MDSQIKVKINNSTTRKQVNLRLHFLTNKCGSQALNGTHLRLLNTKHFKDHLLHNDINKTLLEIPILLNGTIRTRVLAPAPQIAHQDTMQIIKKNPV